MIRKSKHKRKVIAVNDNTSRILNAKRKADALFFWMIIGYFGFIAACSGVALWYRWDKILLAGM